MPDRVSVPLSLGLRLPYASQSDMVVKADSFLTVDRSHQQCILVCYFTLVSH